MKTIKNILIITAAAGVLISGILSILLVLDVASLAEVKDALLKTLIIIGITAATSILTLLILKAAKK